MISQSMPARSNLREWGVAVHDGAIAGSVAGVISSVVLAALSQVETGHPFAAVNATSHWLWRRRSFGQNEATLRYSLSGYTIHHLASMFWGVIAARTFPDTALRPTGKALRNATLVAIAASVGDYLVVPKRLTPGIEARLSPVAVGIFYLSFAAGLFAGMNYVRMRNAVVAAERSEPCIGSV